MKSLRDSTDPGSIRQATEVLLSALDPSGLAWSEQSQRDLRGLPWDWIFERAKYHKVLALLLGRLQEGGLADRLPELARERLDQERLAVADRAARADRTLELVEEIADQLASPFFIIKGGLLAQEVYGSHHLRTFNDVDVVVPTDRVDDFDRALRASGYYFWASPQIHQDLPRWFLREAPPGEERGSQAEARRAMSRFHRHFLFVLKEGDPRLPVEVHWHIFVPGDSRATEDDLWQRTTTLEIGRQRVDVLDREATLLHCAVHALEDGPEKHRLLHLADVIWILHRWGPTMDPQSLRDLAQAWKLESALTAALEGARNVFPFPLPDTVNTLWPHRSPWARRNLRIAGLGPDIVELTVSKNRFVRFLGALRRDTFWELAGGRVPLAAWGRIRRLVASRVLRKSRVPVATS